MARADTIDIQVPSLVVPGQVAKLKLTVNDDILGAELTLVRDDGKRVSLKLPRLGSGATREVALPGGGARHHFTGQLATRTQGGGRAEQPLAFDVVEAGPLQLQVPKDKVDLKEHHLEVTVSREPAKVHITVVGESGQTLADADQDLSGQAAGVPLRISWEPSSDEAVAKIELKVYDRNDFYTGVMLTPWSINIPHEEVNFKTDSSAVEASEEGKLQASLVKINTALETHKEIARGVRLFIGGHTDRVGNDAYNFRLSQARAQSIGHWFRAHGLRVPVAYEGFGESALAVMTADGVDEPRNRRVDYILSVDEPSLRTTGFRPVWKRVN